MIKTLQSLVDSVHKAHIDSSDKALKKATYRKGDVDVEIMSLSQNGDIVIYQWVDKVKVYRCVFTGTAEDAKEYIANKEW